jgi:hypothetical protein
MSAARILTLYRAIFVALLSLASLQALLVGREGGHNIVLLAGAEIAAALALLWRPTQVIGACVLLGIFAVAQVLSALAGQWPTQFLQYAASTLLIVAMGRTIRSPREGARCVPSRILSDSGPPNPPQQPGRREQREL